MKLRLFRILFGLACALLGATLIARPFRSLGVLIVLVAATIILTGISEYLEARETPRKSDDIVALIWIGIGVGSLLWPDLSIRAITFVVGILMVLGGIYRITKATRKAAPNRFTLLIVGASSFIFGALALAWPDITVLAVAVIFGARTFFFGATVIWKGLRGNHANTHKSPGKVRRFANGMVHVGALVVALMLVAVSVLVNKSGPVVDEFYSAPSTVPNEPGKLLKFETFTRDVPENAKAWRILYTTTRSKSKPALASAIVVAPKTKSKQPRPVIAWAHGTTGINEKCAPSVLEHPFLAGATPALDEVVDNGWVMVATDYIGLGTKGPHPYIIGEGEGRSVLDAVRAARELDDANTSNEVVVWGHSQGGNAALWTGQLAQSYAPEINIEGVAALAPASDPAGLVDNLSSIPGGSIFASYVITAYSENYPDVRLEDYVRPGALSIVEESAERCLSGAEVLVSVATSLPLDKWIFDRDAKSGSFGKRLAENRPSGKFGVPLFLGQGTTDPLIVPKVQKAYAKSQCDLGQKLEYREYAGRDHVGVVTDGSPLIPDLLEWTDDRLAGREPVSTDCSDL